MISYTRNLKELVWYQELIFKDDELIGEIFTNIDEGGYNLRKYENVQIQGGFVSIPKTIAHFESVCDAKDFVNQANGI